MPLCFNSFAAPGSFPYQSSEHGVTNSSITLKTCHYPLYSHKPSSSVKGPCPQCGLPPYPSKHHRAMPLPGVLLVTIPSGSNGSPSNKFCPHRIPATWKWEFMWKRNFLFLRCYFQVISTPNIGPEHTAPRSRASCTTDRANQARHGKGVFPDTPWCWTSHLWTWEVTRFCCLKPPGLWSLVTTASGNQNTIEDQLWMRRPYYGTAQVLAIPPKTCHRNHFKHTNLAIPVRNLVANEQEECLQHGGGPARFIKM